MSRLRTPQEAEADMREADRLAALSKSAANVIEFDKSALTAAQLTATASTVGAFASLATFYATRAMWGRVYE